MARLLLVGLVLAAACQGPFDLTCDCSQDPPVVTEYTGFWDEESLREARRTCWVLCQGHKEGR